ncbi:MAG: rRNA large subunit methyltransferase I, partial [Candidatus Edwardsbacteria bacterium]|nr:rRNA large subunit methyltransferase I [Candidatus Edwardsbacteria bacterium]
MRKILLRKNQERRIKAGHPWVFSNEIWELPDGLAPAEVVEVGDGHGHYLGTGFYNGHSLIAVRLFSRRHEELDTAFIAKRIAAAAALRQELYPGSQHYRLAYGESDDLPGLIIDRYGGQLVMDVMSLGLDMRKQAIIEALKQALDPSCIYERSDSYSRKLEGLEPAVGVLSGNMHPDVIIEENDLKFHVNLELGQK